jgi:hypothetical protein
MQSYQYKQIGGYSFSAEEMTAQSKKGWEYVSYFLNHEYNQRRPSAELTNENRWPYIFVFKRELGC